MSNEYLAGIIDGEGSIMLSRESNNSQYRYPVVSVSNTSPAIISWLKDNYGGTVVIHKKYEDRHKQSWVWRVRHRAAIDMCRVLAPLLKDESKSERAQMLAEKYDLVTKRNGKYTEEERQAKLSFEEEFLGPFV